MEHDQKRQAVLTVLKKLLPAMEVDGGGISEFTVSADNIVAVKFKGTCIFCPSQKLTLNLGIRKTLLNELPWIREVVAA